MIFRNKIFHTAFAELRMQFLRRGVRDVALFFKPAESLTFKPCERLLWRFVCPSVSGRRKRLQSRSLSLEGFGAFVGSEEKFKEREGKGNPGRLWRTRTGNKWNGCNLRCCPCSSGWLRLSSLRMFSLRPSTLRLTAKYLMSVCVCSEILDCWRRFPRRGEPLLPLYSCSIFICPLLLRRTRSSYLSHSCTFVPHKHVCA